jgi:hypothetical protein
MSDDLARLRDLAERAIAARNINAPPIVCADAMDAFLNECSPELILALIGPSHANHDDLDEIERLRNERDAAVSLRKLAHTAKSRAEESELRCAQELDEAKAEHDVLRAALAELVACKDLKDLADYNLLYAQTTGDLELGKKLTEEYRHRKVDAWRAARAALVAAAEEKKG